MDNVHKFPYEPENIKTTFDEYMFVINKTYGNHEIPLTLTKDEARKLLPKLNEFLAQN